MRILFLGDVVGRSGRDGVAAALPRLREALGTDLVVVNGENASHGFGLAPDMAQALFVAGADVITLGNHSWDRRELIPYMAQEPRVIRPLNFPPGTPGAGSFVAVLADGRRAFRARTPTLSAQSRQRERRAIPAAISSARSTSASSANPCRSIAA